MGQFVIGVDVGGTNVKLGVVSASAKVIARSNFSTKAYSSSKSQLIEAIVVNVLRLAETAQVTRKHILGVGIGLPGLIDFKKGVVNTMPNIPGWNKFPLRQLLRQKLRLPVFIENDVNLMALGEWRYGAGKGVQNLVCITLGTGLGGGLILNNRLYRGAGFAAGEAGHMPLNEEGPSCKCGSFGCFETYVGNSYLQEKARHIFRKEIALEEVTELAEHGDPRAVHFWQDFGMHIGNGLAGIVNLLNPSRIVVGGGLSNCPAFVFKTIDQVIKRRALEVPAQMVKIVKAKLGNDAPLLGAKVLVESV
jgi:glucokinase